MKKIISSLLITVLILCQGTVCFAGEASTEDMSTVSQVSQISQDSTDIAKRGDTYSYRYSVKPGNSKSVSYGSYDLIGDDTFTTNTQSSNPGKAYGYTTDYTGSLSVSIGLIEANVGYSIGKNETVNNSMNTGTGLAGYRVKTYSRPIYTITKVTILCQQYLNGVPTTQKPTQSYINTKRITGVSMKQEFYLNGVLKKTLTKN